jgi:hypothetical protein
MAIESKFHHPPTVDRVLVSEGTRSDAKPVNGIRFETYCEERDHWVSVKRRLESELIGYTKTAFSRAQSRIRREHSTDPDASFRAWMSQKASMDGKRQNLIKQKNRAEDEILRLKSLVKQENIRTTKRTTAQAAGCLEEFDLFREDGKLCWDGVASQLLLELRAIRGLLEDK